MWRRGRGRPRLAPWDSSWAYVIVSMLGNIVYEAALSVQGPLLYSLGATVATYVLFLALRRVRGWARRSAVRLRKAKKTLPVDASTGSVARSRCGALARCYAANDLRTIPLGSLKSR